MWWNEILSSWMCSRQICSNCVMRSCQYGPKSLRNVSNILLNLCHEELGQFWRQRGVQPGNSKVYLIKWPVSVFWRGFFWHLSLSKTLDTLPTHTHTHTHIHTPSVPSPINQTVVSCKTTSLFYAAIHTHTQTHTPSVTFPTQSFSVSLQKGHSIKAIITHNTVIHHECNKLFTKLKFYFIYKKVCSVIFFANKFGFAWQYLKLAVIPVACAHFPTQFLPSSQLCI